MTIDMDLKRVYNDQQRACQLQLAFYVGFKPCSTKHDVFLE